MVFVEGRLQTRSWDDQNGQKRYSTEIVANNVQFLPQGANASQGSAGYSGAAGGGNEEGNSFNRGGGYEPTSFGSSFDSGAGFPSAESQAFNQNAGTSAFDDVPF
jgi:single-strand DNA-binding protein